MPWAAGVYTKGNAGTGGWTGDQGRGTGIESGLHDTQDNDFTTGINSTLNKDGSNVPSANLPMGGFRHTGVGLATARDSYATLGQAQDGTAIWGGTSGGTANAQTLTLSPAITAYAAGQRFGYFAVATNTGALTININGLGAKAVQWRNLALTGNEIEINAAVEIVYDGTAFQSVQLAGKATSRAQAPTLAQVQDSTALWGGTSGGAANAQTLTLTPPITAYVAGQRFRFVAGFTNLAATTLNVNGVGAINIITQSTGVSLPSNYITSGAQYEVVYNGTAFVLLGDPALIKTGSYDYLGQSTGTANALVLTSTGPKLANTTPYKVFLFASNLTNTGAVTVAIDGLPAINVTSSPDGTALKAGQIILNRFYQLILSNGGALLANPDTSWQSWTPVLTQGGAVTSTIQEATYKISNSNEVTAVFKITATSAGVVANVVNVSLPITAAWSADYTSIGSAQIIDASATAGYVSVAVLATTGLIRFASYYSTGANYWGVNPSIALANGDIISATVTYRI